MIPLLVAACFLFASCSIDSIPVVPVTIDPSVTYQRIAGFGASDCWTANFVGRFWEESEKEKIARLLFSKGFNVDGSPEGIGLSMWRFNLGAGTFEQGDASGIEDLSRRAESFLNPDGSYDWSKQQGQQWFLKKAKEYGCESFTAFSNAPPVQFSRNGKGYAPGDGKVNLRDDAWGYFAAYMADVLDHFQREGLPFDYISPVNEPQWDWKAPTQEGSPWENHEIKRLVLELDKAIRERGLDTKILLSEAGEWDKLYLAGGRGANQIDAFFNPLSPEYVGDLPSMPKIIGGHSYWTHSTNINLRNTRMSVRNSARRFGLEVFQTEWCMLEAGEGFPGYDEASYMDIALFMAKIIHSDLVYADVSSWCFWTSMDMERWEHKNRFLLVSLDPGKNGDPYTPVTESGAAEARATLWALGNYSRFIRPGYTRIETGGADDLNGLMGSAYISADKKTITAVYVNMAHETRKVNASFQNSGDPKTSSVYVTDADSNLKKKPSPASYRRGETVEIPARSVVTVVYGF
jgi:O-glycosyl hydrolase